MNRNDAIDDALERLAGASPRFAYHVDNRLDATTRAFRIALRRHKPQDITNAVPLYIDENPHEFNAGGLARWANECRNRRIMVSRALDEETHELASDDEVADAMAKLKRITGL